MTAKDLLYQLLEYQYKWSHDDHATCAPARIRYERIMSLALAFGALQPGKPLSVMTTGLFLDHQPMENINAGLMEKIMAFTKERYPDALERRPIRRMDMVWLFKGLFTYRQKVYDAERNWSGMLEGFSAGAFYGGHLQYQLTEIIEQNIGEIDETLVLLLDPQQRVLTALPEAYPDVDLGAIDSDWLAENM